MTSFFPDGVMLPPLLGDLFPPYALSRADAALLLRVQGILDADIAPHAADHDRNGRYPVHAVSLLKQAGLLMLPVPRAYGGMGATQALSLEVMVRIAAADPAVAQIYKVHDDLVREIFSYATPAFCHHLAQHIMSEHAIIGMAVAENGRTADSFLQTLAIGQSDGQWVLRGRKIYATGAAGADLIAISSFDPQAAQHQGDARAGLRFDLVPRSAPGLRILRDWDRMGQRATDSGTVILDDVRVSAASNALAPQSVLPVHTSLRHQAGFSAILVGIGIGALRAGCAFVAHHSRPWGAAQVEHATDDPYVQRMVGEMGADLSVAYCAVRQCGELLDLYERGGLSRAALAMPVSAARSVATRAALRATSDILAATGARGTDALHGFDRYWRDARTLSLHDPVDWKNAEIGRHLLTGWTPEPGPYQ
ncbi:acyl-CoA dehydrogenase family protein [Novacetimonas hansenii]|uniref:acyl-CoA dehydrogenase family protein n=1 Tax=Novacetimonas hansenii TaxID=436 RepID=UPI00079A8693|nr:acyl-CoA dehydrogenase family protein [Novacetimonas hansenii]PYD71562.1 acyl-CoA dehydrogenase [Novacetimonas hansenii]WEQ58825.1 acyl-CoA dehydrogenase family protein [Novacetimonas hansenii]CUW47685.1 Dibenzothiophene desulfurization enzyme C [Novacetimonas hansenii]